MLLLLWRCQLRHVNHAYINIATSVIGGQRWNGIWRIRRSPTGYWRSLKLMRFVRWRSGWLLTNWGHLRWINEWFIPWRKHRYHRWWQLIALWVNVVAIKAFFITRTVRWRPGDCWQTEDSWGGLMTELFNGRETDITSNDISMLFEWQSLRLKSWLSRRFVRRLPWLFPVPLLWHLPRPFLERGMMNTIWVCGDIVCLVFYLSIAIIRWAPNFWRD